MPFFLFCPLSFFQTQISHPIAAWWERKWQKVKEKARKWPSTWEIYLSLQLSQDKDKQERFSFSRFLSLFLSLNFLSNQTQSIQFILLINFSLISSSLLYIATFESLFIYRENWLEILINLKPRYDL